MSGHSSKIVHSPFPDVYIKDQPMYEFLFDACDRHLNRVAFIDLFSGLSYSYGELGARCRSVAVGWHRAGLRKGDGLALLLPNCAQFVFAFTAAATRGALCSGLNPAFGQYELTHYLGLSHGGTGAKFVVCTNDTLSTLDSALEQLGDQHRVQCIFVVDAKSDSKLRRCKKSKVAVKPFSLLYANPDAFGSLPIVHVETRADAVYMPYSSGTTGLPKGVLVSHYMMAAQFAQMSPSWYLQPRLGEHSVMFLPIFHMYGFIVFFKQLNDGCTIVSLPRFTLDKFFGAVAKYKAPMLYLVPPIMVMMAKDPKMDNFDLGCVKEICVGAAPVGEEITMDLKRRFPVIKYTVQAYGMSELGISHMQTPVGDGANLKIASVGPMLPNYKAIVVDTKTGAWLGPNEIGELWCTSPAIMLGYHRNEAETRATIDENNWLHTGDMGYYDTDSNFYIVDRVKELIKVSGFQVAPAEIEDLLLANEHVADAAVVPVASASKGQVPRAYIVPASPAVCNDEKRKLAAEIVHFVEEKYSAERVAHYKRLEGGIEFIDKIPKLPSGKILRRVLRQRTETQMKMAKHVPKGKL